MAQEVDKLFQMMRMLKSQGIALIYISHKMDEIFEISRRRLGTARRQPRHDQARLPHER